MPPVAFHHRFITFCECNHQFREQEFRKKRHFDPLILDRRQDAYESLIALYPQGEDRALVAKAIVDPYFPLTMLRRLHVEGFAREPKFDDLTEAQLAALAAEHLLKWAELFLTIRQDLARLNTHGQVSNMNLSGSPQESFPEPGWCNYCGGCCEIRGGPPEFTGPLPLPDHWLRYFKGDGCNHQRFCPFLFEYLATARFFCAIYKVKPRCCWEFDREECKFLQEDVARERAERSWTPTR